MLPIQTGNPSAPPGAFPQPPPPVAATKAKKKKKSKGKKGGDGGGGNGAHEGGHDDDDDEDSDDLPPLEDVDSDPPSIPLPARPSSRTSPAPPAPPNFVNPPHPHAHSSPSDLLSTASDLYRQIEAAAASALSTHPSFAASFPPPPPGTGAATDEAYWTSLPQHLRQFIRSALPLAAGLTAPPGPGGVGVGVGVTGVNGQPLPPLTHDQLSSAAAQLAQVVQSNWGQLGLGPIPAAATAGQNRTGSATISLGSFPVTMPTREQMEAAIGSMGGLSELGIGGGEEEQFELTEDEDSKEFGEQTKKKSKKKKKKAAAAAAAAPPPPPPAPVPGPRPPVARSNPPNTPPPPPRAPAAQTNGKEPAPQQQQQQQQKYYPKAPPPGAYPHTPPAPPPAPTPSIAPKAGPSSERERIRDFWLGLEEGERRALVKVEKEAVLRKMKEQQRSGCSCAVCGRKRCVAFVSRRRKGELTRVPSRRTAIEEELEVLYDAYYDELESYANHQVRYASSGYTIAPPPGPGPFPGSVDAASLPSPAPPPKKPSGIVKTTRDHKNVRPAAKKKPAQSDGPAHGEPGHTHSQSCPHHPHNHTGHATPATTAAKAKGAAVEEQYEEDDEGDEEEEDEYDEDEEEYDEEDEEEEVCVREGGGGDGADRLCVCSMMRRSRSSRRRTRCRRRLQRQRRRMVEPTSLGSARA